MPQLKLTYFNFHGGRAEPVRLALHIGGVAFEDHRFTFPEFAEVRKSTPFGQVPTLQVDGVQVTQCDSILRYAGILADGSHGIPGSSSYREEAPGCCDALGLAPLEKSGIKGITPSSFGPWVSRSSTRC